VVDPLFRWTHSFIVRRVFRENPPSAVTALPQRWERCAYRDRLSFRFSLLARPFCYDCGRNSSTRAEVALYFGPDWFGPSHHIFQHLIHDVFLKDAQVAVRLQVFLVGLQFEAEFVWLIAQRDYAEIGQAGFGADGGELGIVDYDFVAGELVGPGFDLGKIGVEPGGGVLGRVAGAVGHSNIVAGWRSDAAGEQQVPHRSFGPVRNDRGFVLRADLGTTAGL
jgi:hypothetical protein